MAPIGTSPDQCARKGGELFGGSGVMSNVLACLGWTMWMYDIEIDSSHNAANKEGFTRGEAVREYDEAAATARRVCFKIVGSKMAGPSPLVHCVIMCCHAYDVWSLLTQTMCVCLCVCVCSCVVCVLATVVENSYPADLSLQN